MRNTLLALRSGQSPSGHNHTTLVGLTESGFGNHGKKVCTDVVTCESSRDVASTRSPYTPLFQARGPTSEL